MMKPAETCKDEIRRIDVRREGINGIDYIEARLDGPAPALTVYFFGGAPSELTADHIAIEGGVRITGIHVVDVQLGADAQQPGSADVTLDKAGDFSTYTLRIAGVQGFDPVYSSFDFTFRPDCPADLDCADQPVCPPEARQEPEINYLAKDYQSFRQLILDRWALIMPEWRERHAPDIGIALAEILAYTGDYLSYYQDAVATEAYLGTARQRISVRRHARLVDYRVHEGCNARALLCLEADGDTPEIDANHIFFITDISAALPNAGVLLKATDLDPLPPGGYEVYEPLGSEIIRLHKARNRIGFYTWGDSQCCLPRGAVNATLRDDWSGPDEPPVPPDGHEPPPPPSEPPNYPAKPPVESYGAKDPPADDPRKAARQVWGPQPDQMAQVKPPRPRMLDSLQPGDILIFVEVLGPNTGQSADADPLHRHPVRLTRVERAIDELYRQPVVNLWWDAADALPFPLCLSSLGGSPECKCIEDVTIACGNVILVDHGRRFDNDPLDGCVPLEKSEGSCLGPGLPAEQTQTPGAFRPVLKRGPLTFSQEPCADTPASKVLQQDPSEALPFVTLNLVTLAGVWDAELDAGKGKQAAVLLFEQMCEQLGGSFTGALGSFNVQGEAPRKQVFWKLLNLPATDPVASFSGALQDGVLAGTFETKDSKGTFRASRRRPLTPWIPRRELLASGPRDNHFVVEMDNDGIAHFRFGDGELGRAPEAGAGFTASYRIGNGPAGNLGHSSINHMVLRTAIDGLGVTGVTNPLPASGGTPPESLADIKLLAPSAFRSRLERAITADDYASLAERNPRVQRAAARLRFTGSRYAVSVAIDPLGSEKPSPALLDEIKGCLYPYRRIGHDLEVVAASYVPLQIEMTICVKPGYLSAHVKVAVLEIFGSGVLPNGRLGLFHPDSLSFGDSIYLSRLVASAQAADGVEAVQATTLERLNLGPNHEIENGVLPIGPLEIARLDNDPNFPENGRLTLNMRGGR